MASLRPGDHRCTPESVLQPVRRFAPIGLDPFSNGDATVRARQEYRLELGENGLELPWEVRRQECIWVNGPWSRPRPTAIRVAQHATFARSHMGILVWTQAATETLWAKTLWDVCSRVCFWGRRVNHPLPGGGDDGMMWPTMLWYVGSKVSWFDHVFRGFGQVVGPIRDD